MIGNVIRGQGVRGVLDYIAGKDDAELLSTNLLGTSPRSFAKQFGEVRQLYARDTVADPVVHIPLRNAPGEDLTNDEWKEVVGFALDRLRFKDAPYVAYLHDHGDARHLHIVTYRVDFHGKLVSDSNDRRILAAVTRELSERYGLTVAPSPGTNQHSLTRPELERLLANPNRGEAKEALRHALDEAAASQRTLRGFLTALHKRGVRAEIKVARNTGALQGISLNLPDGSVVKGSDLGKKYSLGQLCSRHDLREDLQPDGPVLRLRDLSEREYQSLVNDRLAPDAFERHGRRYDAYWLLPQDSESRFADLLSTRLPHRFLSFTDEFPSPTTTPDLVERGRVVQLWEELQQRPAFAPSLHLPAPQSPQPSPELLHFSRRVEALDSLAAALIGAAEEPAPEAARLRAEYHSHMAAVLLADTSIQSVYPADGGSVPHHKNDACSFNPAPTNRPGSSASEPETVTAPRLEAEVAPVQLTPSSPLPSPAGEPDTVTDPRQEAEVAPVQLALSSPLPSPPGEPETLTPPSSTIPAEKALILSTSYENDPTETAFRDFARFEESSRAASRPPIAAPILDNLILERALETQAGILLQAQDAFTANPSTPNAEAFARERLAYEAIAAKLEHHPRHPFESDAPDSAVSLSAAQERYLSDPSAANQALWLEARIANPWPQPLSKDQPPRVQATSLVKLFTQRVSEQRTEVARLESQFIASPTDPRAQAQWSHALSVLVAERADLARAWDRLRAERRAELDHRTRVVLFYQNLYLEQPSPRNASLWRHAEKAFQRASLSFEKVRLADEAKARRQPLPRSSRTRIYSSASRDLLKAFEKQVAGQIPRADRLASRAASALLSRTPIAGRAAQIATHPIRAAVAALPGGRLASTAAGFAVDAGRHSLKIYLEARAARDRVRGPLHGRLQQGDFSNRALAAAAIQARLDVTPAATGTLLEAQQRSRSAEAALLGVHRNFRTGLDTPQNLNVAAARALGARAAVTEHLLKALDLPTLGNFTAAFPKGDSRALTAWIKVLQNSGLSARAITAAVVEAAPLASASAGAGLLIAAGRKVVTTLINHFRSQALEILRDQNEQRR